MYIIYSYQCVARCFNHPHTYIVDLVISRHSTLAANNLDARSIWVGEVEYASSGLKGVNF